MRLSVGHGTPISSHSLLKSVLREPFMVSKRSPLTKAPWICQRCYSQRTVKAKIERQLNKPSTFGSKLPNRFGLHTKRLYSQNRSPSDAAENEPTKQRSDLPSEEEGRRSHLSKRFSHVMDHLQSNIFIAGQRLNDLTGYSGIEALKKDIEQQGHKS